MIIVFPSFQCNGISDCYKGVLCSLYKMYFLVVIVAFLGCC